MLNTCSVFGLMRLQNRYFLAILLYRKHNMFIQKKNSNPSQVLKQLEYHLHKKQIYAFQNKNLLRRQSLSRSYFRFYFGTQGKKIVLWSTIFWTRRQFSCRQRKLHICWLVGENCLVFLRGIRCDILCNVPCIWCITVFCGKIT